MIRMKKILLTLLILNFYTTQNTFADDTYDSYDIVEMYNDPAWVKEITEIQEIDAALLNLVVFQNDLQNQISIYLDEFFFENISNEELWVQLDSIENQIGTYSEDYDGYVKSINTKTSISNPTGISLYKNSLETTYDLNDYQISNNLVTRDLLSSLAEGDIDNYSYLASRSYLKTADFLELVASNNKMQAERMPKNNIGKYVLLVDADVINYVAKATRVNAFQMLNELDKKKLNEFKPLLDNAYKVIAKGKSYSSLVLALKNFEGIIEELESNDKDYSSFIEVMERVTVNAKLLSDANLRNAKTWKDIVDFYIRYIDNIENLYDSPSRLAEFNEIQARQNFVQKQIAKYTKLYQEASIEFTKIAPEFITL